MTCAEDSDLEHLHAAQGVDLEIILLELILLLVVRTTLKPQ